MFTNFEQDGFTVIENVYDNIEVETLIKAIDDADTSNPTFRKSDDLFAIRQFFNELPEIKSLVFNKRLKQILSEIFGNDYFVVKSIYFDKPERSNWFVAWHQDLTISVDKKVELPGYTSWTNKHNQFAVQPPINILEGNFTIRIHLDDTDGNNGALKVIPGSHLKGVHRTEAIEKSNVHTCSVKHGGVMLMRPLLFHSSDRTTNQKRRRVIHVEFSNSSLPEQINWSELN